MKIVKQPKKDRLDSRQIHGRKKRALKTLDHQIKAFEYDEQERLADAAEAAEVRKKVSDENVGYPNSDIYKDTNSQFVADGEYTVHASDNSIFLKEPGSEPDVDEDVLREYMREDVLLPEDHEDTTDSFAERSHTVEKREKQNYHRNKRRPRDKGIREKQHRRGSVHVEIPAADTKGGDHIMETLDTYHKEQHKKHQKWEHEDVTERHNALMRESLAYRNFYKQSGGGVAAIEFRDIIEVVPSGLEGHIYEQRWDNICNPDFLAYTNERGESVSSVIDTYLDHVFSFYRDNGHFLEALVPGEQFGNSADAIRATLSQIVYHGDTYNRSLDIPLKATKPGMEYVHEIDPVRRYVEDAFLKIEERINNSITDRLRGDMSHLGYRVYYETLTLLDKLSDEREKLFSFTKKDTGVELKKVA